MTDQMAGAIAAIVGWLIGASMVPWIATPRQQDLESKRPH